MYRRSQNYGSTLLQKYVVKFFCRNFYGSNYDSLDYILKDREISTESALANIYIINRVIFVLFRDSQTCSFVQSHLRGMFLCTFWNKGYHLKVKNLIYKISADLFAKHEFFCSKNVDEKTFTSYLWSEADL